MKKKKNIDVPIEFLPILEQAKREFKILTGKKKATHADGFRMIAASTKMFKYKKFSFEKKEAVK